jgi:endonuclease/exonuclease/phosphatase (EEP) superfamily protein YafD
VRAAGRDAARSVVERARSLGSARGRNQRGNREGALRRREPREVRVIAVLVRGYLAGALLVAALLWTLGDQWWPATVLLFSGRWIFLLPVALLVPAALMVGRPRLLGPVALGALVVLGPVMGFRTGWRRLLPGSGASVPIRVVTFNADGGGAVAPRLSLLLAEWRADVVALQECGPALQSAVRVQAGWYHHEVDQLCVLSRFPLGSAAVMDRSALAALHAESDIGGAGYVVRYVVDAPAGRFGFVNLHLETPRKGFEALMRGDVGEMKANTRLRDLESDLARRWVDGALAPTVIAGDFNTPVESRIFARHWGDLADAFSHAGRGLGMTKYNGWIRVRIDHVLTGAGWHAVRATVGADAGSDHRPLIVELERR